MKKSNSYLFLFVLFFLFSAGRTNAQFGAMPPFTFDMEPVINAGLPGFHSFAFAQSGSKWLIIGGRTNGLHGMNANDGFLTADANNNVVVIDTVTWQVYTSSLSALPYAIADPLRCTNMQYFADSTYLYVIGGYGRDSVLNQYVTFPTLSAIHINNIINAVLNNTSLAPHIRQITDTNLRVCGGELAKISSDYYLCFGHDFEGRYADPPVPIFTQIYSNQVKKFDIVDNGVTMSISNYVTQTDTNNFHRRDINVIPEIRPNGTEALGAFAGVFQKTVNWPWLQPIEIQANGSTLLNYQQQMNHYKCFTIPIYDSLSQRMYSTFFGGMSLNDFNPQNNTIAQDSLVPFVTDVTTFRKDPNGYMEETVLPIQLPGYLGTNAVFVPREDISMYDNGVIRFRALPNQRTLVGYLFGGIRGTGTNLFPTTANDTVYRVFITPDLTPGFEEHEGSISSFSVFPNPSNGIVRITFSLNETTDAVMSVFDLTGKKVSEVLNRKCNKGIDQFSWQSGLAPGMYIMLFRTEKETKLVKLAIQ